MKTKKNNISSLDELESEINSLHQRKEVIENDINENWDHLKTNFPAMLRHSIFKKATTEFHNSWAQTIFSIPKVQEAVGNTLEKVSVKLEEVFLHWFDKVFPKKD